MFTYVKLKNYKSLVDFEVDLTSSKNNPKKMIIIYGENGAGKSNFIDSFFTLFDTLNTKIYKTAVDKFMSETSDDKKELEFFFNKVLKDNFKNLDTIIEKSKTIGSKDNMVLEFGFKLNGKNGVYYIETDNESIVKEKLEYVLDKNKTKYFELSNKDNYINSSLFKSDKYLNEIKDLVDKFWGKHSFLSILLFEQEDKSKKYISKNINNNIFEVIKYFSSMSIHIKNGSNIEKGKISIDKKFVSIMDNGSIKINEEEKLNHTEKILNNFFTSIYSDIKKVYYKTEEKDDKLHYNLFIKKQIYGKIIDIDFKLESTGTQKLLRLFPLIISSMKKNNVVAIDELDSGIHDILTASILKSLFSDIKGQFILTTHNTTILESDIKKECIYIFNIDSEGKKILVPITEYDKEHPNINFRKRYLKGIYYGIPIVSDIDFKDILEE
ncbi:AAA family ATPase [Brachyspira pilosicoli]|uniref:ATP-binding protein n=1 Tax=Brachyspira pilosicoli TaxID=52584 RepID=A0AAJ6K7H4_BRAPL|nr:ATP-binding protein [Brachyspira pilosicoli]WIH87356.1 ATP-binding protein [Brachyspira pilosicoli]WIH89636.1 ATP-binding protein [Brachyspira pilosicoli]WIH91931.1 ATP-binding protein [Brachyspira pilosicoli]WIH94160.1 ATP-binding protein [Brachyspira pilosicoli]